jgi:uncharacterized SAM-binding protein YcdF (DUF218 family)
MVPRGSKLMRAAGIAGGALLVLIAVTWLLRAPLLTMAGALLVKDDGPRKADAILVLGGDDSGARIIKAAQLATEGYSSYVLVSGPPNLLGHDSDGTIEFARRNGYPGSLFRPIWLPPGTDSTRSEATFLGNYLRTHAIHNILLVTSNFHSRRAARLWRKQAPWIAVTVVAAPDPSFTPDGWWKTRTGQKVFLLEWTKTVAAWLGD